MVSRALFSMGPIEYLEGILLRPLAAGSVFILFLWPLRDRAGTWTALLALAATSALLYCAAGFLLLRGEDRLAIGRLWTTLRSGMMSGSTSAAR